jgi:chromosome segregation ATPase
VRPQGPTRPKSLLSRLGEKKETLFSFLGLVAAIAGLVATIATLIDTARLDRPTPNLEARIRELSENLTTASKSIDDVEREIIARQNLVQRLAEDQRRYEELAKLQQPEVEAVAQALREQIQAENRRSFWSNLAINLALSIGSAIGGALFGIWYERRVLVRRRDSIVQ